jgi:hypothetical protein
MNVIKTIAPIAIEDLKLYFADKTISYLINYDDSSIQDEKLLTYLGNLDLPSDIEFDPSKESHLSLLKVYFEIGSLVNIPSLEKAACHCLFEYKGIIDSNKYESFIEQNKQSILEWTKRLDSLTIFNLYVISVEKFKTWAQETFEEDNSDSSKYINFVNLLKHKEFYTFFQKIDDDNLRYYSKLFNDYCFKGNNLYSHWSNENNPMFLLTFGIATGEITGEKYVKAIKEQQEVFEEHDS